MDTTAPIAPPPAPTSAPTEPAKSEEQKISEGAGGAGPAVSAPKPVQVLSVPQTPLNNATPAGGSPRPELKIDEEPKEAPKEQDPVIEQVNDPLATVSSTAPKEDVPMPDKPASEAINGDSKAASTAGESTTSAAGEKRKLDEHVEEATNGDTKLDTEPADKKAKVEDVKTAQANEVEEPTTNGKVGRPRKGSQAKKQEKEVPALGKTMRKTRSQGPAEVDA